MAGSCRSVDIMPVIIDNVDTANIPSPITHHPSPVTCRYVVTSHIQHIPWLFPCNQLRSSDRFLGRIGARSPELPGVVDVVAHHREGNAEAFPDLFSGRLEGLFPSLGAG